jgi:hypothetical protein
MSLLSEFQTFAREILAEFGPPAGGTLRSMPSTYATDGTVTGTPVDVSVTLAGPVEESKRWRDLSTEQTVTGTFYVSAVGLSLTPKLGDRLVVGGRTWQVANLFPLQLQGGTVAFRLDCGEVGNG